MISLLRWARHSTIALSSLVASFIVMQSCSNEPYVDGPGIADGTEDCVRPTLSWKDDFGNWDPCCEHKACCPNPLLDHFSIVNGDVDYRQEWDPCCKVAPCPGHNPWLPKDPPAPSDMPDGGSTSDASACNDTCDGECVPRAMPPFSGPLLVHFGPVGEDVGCPAGSKEVLTNHFTDLSIPPLSCPGCACDPPTGECGLPGKMTAHSGNCPGSAQGSGHTDFSPPPNWDGTCTSTGAIPSGAQCNGKPCVRSLSVEPLTMKENGCAPRTTGAAPPPGPPTWQTAATVCQPSTCKGGEGACVTKAGPSPPEWAVCVATDGEGAACSAPFPDKHVIHEGFADSRACSACSCDPPSGSSCLAGLQVYEGGSCQGTAALGGVAITTNDAPFCFDLPPGEALGSKVMGSPIFRPGSCEPRGGGSTGGVALTGAVTLCCRVG